MNNLDFLKPVKVRSAVDMVTDQLTESIINGRFRPGDKIPTESEMAETFHVGRNTVREAVRVLVGYGVLEIRRPEGTFVCSTFKPQTLNPLIYGLMIQGSSAGQELCQLDDMIWTGVVCSLFRRGLSREEADLLRQKLGIVQSLAEERPGDLPVCLAAHRDFMAALIDLTGNEILLYLFDFIFKLLYTSRLEQVKDMDPVARDQYVTGYLQLIQALKSGDRELLDQSLENLRRRRT